MSPQHGGLGGCLERWGKDTAWAASFPRGRVELQGLQGSGGGRGLSVPVAGGVARAWPGVVGAWPGTGGGVAQTPPHFRDTSFRGGVGRLFPGRGGALSWEKVSIAAPPHCLKLIFRFRRASRLVVGFVWLHFLPVKMRLLHYRTAKRSLFLKATLKDEGEVSWAFERVSL